MESRKFGGWCTFKLKFLEISVCQWSEICRPYKGHTHLAHVKKYQKIISRFFLNRRSLELFFIFINITPPSGGIGVKFHSDVSCDYVNTFQFKNYYHGVPGCTCNDLKSIALVRPHVGFSFSKKIRKCGSPSDKHSLKIWAK